MAEPPEFSESPDYVYGPPADPDYNPFNPSPDGPDAYGPPQPGMRERFAPRVSAAARKVIDFTGESPWEPATGKVAALYKASKPGKEGPSPLAMLRRRIEHVPAEFMKRHEARTLCVLGIGAVAVAEAFGTGHLVREAIGSQSADVSSVLAGLTSPIRAGIFGVGTLLLPAVGRDIFFAKKKEEQKELSAVTGLGVNKSLAELRAPAAQVVRQQAEEKKTGGEKFRDGAVYALAHMAVADCVAVATRFPLTASLSLLRQGANHIPYVGDIANWVLAVPEFLSNGIVDIAALAVAGITAVAVASKTKKSPRRPLVSGTGIAIPNQNPLLIDIDPDEEL